MPRVSINPLLPAPSNPPVPLPQVPGPKLEPFTPTAHADIEFLMYLGRDEDKDSYVWKVNINGNGPYALKMFKFNTWEYLGQCYGRWLSKRLAKPQFYADYFDPFNCECRVYGRLKQEQREELAVRSHGYLLLSSEQAHQVANLMGRSRDDPDDDDPATLYGHNFWDRDEQHRGHPVKAIVKEFVSDGGEGFNKTQVAKLWDDLKEFRKLGILVRDITIHNYIGGKLIDFSRAWTVYHPLFDWTTDSHVTDHLEMEAQELIDLLYTWARVTDQSGFKLPKGLKEHSMGEDESTDLNPGLYDWRKWEADQEAAQIFVDKTLVEKVDE
ncbi:hypothetical protein QC764_0028890 [Podospora pseudoanserina]|uniref:Aminoglycoside phosphotransferase domain-containing protein n=1 Tax=Podospora pseudoanserina TaxID=2609844 RepID=A0ABR0ISM4_9PEZI|nr:hypothetical protein QC764_0028890 [Podospora pseudoanserina]